jgi:hypothetical protein
VGSLITDDLFKKVLLEPVQSGAVELHVVTGYASPAMVTKHLAELRRLGVNSFSIDLLVGMTGIDGLPRSTLAGFLSIPRQSANANFACKFTLPGKSIHSKVYVFSDSRGPVKAFAGSANYTQVGFGLFGNSRVHHEAVVEIDPDLALDYILKLHENSINYLNSQIGDHVNITDEPSSGEARQMAMLYGTEMTDVTEKVNLPLVQTSKNRGEVHERSGLNWGQREGRNPNQAYIPVPAEIARTGFFPDRGIHFQLITDDEESFIATVAQDNDKAIETPNDNSLLGKYFRLKLGVEENLLVETHHLTDYGSNAVEITKIHDGLYKMSFRPGIFVQN